MSLISSVGTVLVAGGGAYGLHHALSERDAEKQRDYDRATDYDRDVHNMDRPGDFTKNVGVLRTGTVAGVSGVLAAGGVLNALSAGDWNGGIAKWTTGSKVTMFAGAALLAGTGASILQNYLAD